MALAPTRPLAPKHAVALLVFACAASVGPLWSPSVALLLGDLVGYFPSLFASLPATWDPMVQGGTPLLPNPQAGWFYPPAWLLRGDLQRGLPWFLFFHFCLGSLACWAWVRTRFGDGWESLAAGVIYGLSGPTFSLALTPDKLPGHAWFPAFLLGLHWWLGDGRSARRAVGCVVAAAAVCAMWFAGSIEGIFIAAMAGPLWALALPGAPPLGRWRRASLALGALALGTALAGVLLVPFFSLLPETARAEALPMAEAMRRSTHPVDWFGWLSPNPFWQGEELRYVIDAEGTSRARWLRTLYGGVVLAGLLPGLGWARRRPAGVGLAGAGALAFVVLALGDLSPLRSLVHAMPGLGSIRYPDKWFLGTVAMQAWLGAAALYVARRDPRAARAAAWATAALLMVALVGLTLPYGGGAAQRAASRLSDSAALLAVALATLVSWSRGKPVLPWAFVMLLALDLLGGSLRAVPFADADAARTRPAAIAAIRADRARSPADQRRGPARIWDESLHQANRLPDAPLGEPFREMQRAVLAPNIATEHGVAYIDGMRALRLERQARFSAILEDLPAADRRSLLRAVGNDYWLVWGPEEARALVEEAGLSVVPPAPGVPLDVLVLAEPDPLDRVRQVFSWRAFPDDAAAYRFMQARPDASIAVLVNNDPEVDRLPASPDSPRAQLEPLRWRNAGPGRWEAGWRAAEPSLLVLQEAWAPGWEYTIDGGPWQAALRVEHLLVGASLPAGAGTVVVRYRPKGLGSGAGLSVFALIGLLGLARRLRDGGEATRPRAGLSVDRELLDRG